VSSRRANLLGSQPLGSQLKEAESLPPFLPKLIDGRVIIPLLWKRMEPGGSRPHLAAANAGSRSSRELAPLLGCPRVAISNQRPGPKWSPKVDFGVDAPSRVGLALVSHGMLEDQTASHNHPSECARRHSPGVGVATGGSARYCVSKKYGTRCHSCTGHLGSSICGDQRAHPVDVSGTKFGSSSRVRATLCSSHAEFPANPSPLHPHLGFLPAICNSACSAFWSKHVWFIHSADSEAYRLR